MAYSPPPFTLDSAYYNAPNPKYPQCYVSFLAPEACHETVVLSAVEVITITASMLIMEMKDVAIQFYPIWHSLIFSVLLWRRRKNIPHSWVPATLNLDSPDHFIKILSKFYQNLIKILSKSCVSKFHQISSKCHQDANSTFNWSCIWSWSWAWQ